MTDDGRYLFSGNGPDSFAGVCKILGCSKDEYGSFQSWLNRYDFPEEFPWHQHWAEWIACTFKGCMASSEFATVEVRVWSTNKPNIDLGIYDGILNSDLDQLWQRAFTDLESRHLLFDFVGFIMRNQHENDPYAVGALVDPYGELDSSDSSTNEAMTAEDLREDLLNERVEKPASSELNESLIDGTTDLKFELAKAKDLFDEGLIDESEFKDLKRKILGL